MTHTKKGYTRREFIRQATAVSAFMVVPRYVLGGKGYTAPSDRIHLGFIGTGRHGRSLQGRFRDTGEVEIVAACDVYKTNLDYFVKQTEEYDEQNSGRTSRNSCTPYGDFRELLDRPDIDAVVIATPDHWHAIQTVRAAGAGKDIYCEKPLAFTVSEGRAMVEAVERNSRVFQTGSMQRSSSEFRHAVELVRNGYIGEIGQIKVSIGGPPAPYDLPEEPVPEGLDWDFWLGPNAYLPYNHQLVPTPGDDFWARWRYYKEVGGGDMTDWGTHMFDIVQWALDMDHAGPVEVIPPDDGGEYPYLTYRYENGIEVTHENFGTNNAIRFIGSEGSIDVRRGSLETTPVSLQDREIGANEIQVYRSENHYRDWLEAIRNRTQPICDAETGHRSATMCTIGNIAYELQRPLKWNPQEEHFEWDETANGMLSREMREEWAL